MKNLKKMATMLVLVTVMGVSSSMGGVLVGDRQITDDTPPTCTSTTGGGVGGGVILSGVILSGVILSGVILSGVILSGSVDGTSDVPCVLGSSD